MVTLTTTNGERIAFPAAAVVSVREHKPAAHPRWLLSLQVHKFSGIP